MFQRKTRRFRRHQNERSNFSRGNGNNQARLRSNSFSNGQTRNKFRPSLSAEKLLEKYSTLAKEAMSSGDKTLSENYLQHADHFMRIIENKNISQNLNKVQAADKLATSDKHLAESSGVDQNKTTEVKKE